MTRIYKNWSLWRVPKETVQDFQKQEMGGTEQAGSKTH